MNILGMDEVVSPTIKCVGSHRVKGVKRGKATEAGKGKNPIEST